MDYFRSMTKYNVIFAKNLIAWYLRNKRELPWRSTQDPYCIWLSEIMLQQTRVAQGLPYYLKFLEAYPNIKKLANAPEDEVLKLWQGLGYYSRARNLHATAKFIVHQRNGDFPNNFKELLELKGVGDYTASAIASISFNLPEAVVDGNVFRVLSRVFGIPTPINSPGGQQEFKKLAQELIDIDNPGTYNQAIMEFGARFCTPQNPDCVSCIFKTDCFAYKNDMVSALPVKLKAKPVQKRFFNYLVIITKDQQTLLQQRLGKGIWEKLYEFPLIESPKRIGFKDLRKTEDFQNFTKGLEMESVTLYNDQAVIHKLSHQHLYTQFWIVEVKDEQPGFIPVSKIGKYAVPVLIENFVAEFFDEYSN